MIVPPGCRYAWLNETPAGNSDRPVVWPRAAHGPVQDERLQVQFAQESSRIYHLCSSRLPMVLERL
jgi:hypothetical protein